MNPANHPGSSPVPWPTSDDRVRAPDASILPGLRKLAEQERELLPRVRTAASATRVEARSLRDTRDAWVGQVRASVHRSPLMSIAAAFALGALVTRVVR